MSAGVGGIIDVKECQEIFGENAAKQYARGLASGVSDELGIKKSTSDAASEDQESGISKPADEFFPQNQKPAPGGLTIHVPSNDQEKLDAASYLAKKLRDSGILEHIHYYILFGGIIFLTALTISIYGGSIYETLKGIFERSGEIEVIPTPTGIPTFTPEPLPTETTIPAVLPTMTETPTVTPTATLSPIPTPTATVIDAAPPGVIGATTNGIPTAVPGGSGGSQPAARPVTATATRPKPTATPTPTFILLPTDTPIVTNTPVPPTATPIPVIVTIPPTATATPPPVQLTTPPKVQLIDPSEGRVYKTSAKSIKFDWTSVTEPAGVKRYYEIIIQNINDDPAHPTFPQGVNNLTASEYRPQISKAFAQSRGLHRWHVRVRFLANGQEVVGEWSDWRNFRVDE